MKRIGIILLTIILLSSLCACSPAPSHAQIAATTLPVYEFSSIICEGTDLQVVRIISQEISCLHDYTLQVNQVKAIESAQVLVLSGAGLEEGLLPADIQCQTIDASQGIDLICSHNEGHGHDHGHDHAHDQDPHIWLSVDNAKRMAQNICNGLCKEYPELNPIFQKNLVKLLEKLDTLDRYAKETLQDIHCRKLITFHDGFSYMAQAWDLEIVKAIEEESGSEASAKELIHLIELVQENRLPAIFTEKQGSVSAANIISNETGIPSYTLDMAMSGDSYFTAMYQNVQTLKEALG